MDQGEAVIARIRKWIATWNEGGLEHATAIWHEDMVWVEPQGFPDADTHRGRDACVERMRERFALLGVVKIEMLGGELRGDRLLLEVIVSGEGAASGVPAQQHSWWIYEFAEDNRVALWLEFLSREPALAALAEGA